MRTSLIRLESGPYISDIYFQKDTITNRIDDLISHIIQDLNWLRLESPESFTIGGFHGIQVISQSDNDRDLQNIHGIAFQQLSYNLNKSSVTNLFKFLPHSDFDWCKSYWNIFVQDLDTSILTLDAFVRLFSLPGLVCFDIEDVRSFFSPGATFAFSVDSLSVEDIRYISRNSQHLASVFTRYFYIFPTPKDDELRHFGSTLEEVKLNYEISEEAYFLYATYFAPLAQNKGIIIAG